MMQKKAGRIYGKAVLKTVVFLFGIMMWIITLVSAVEMAAGEITESFETDAYTVNRCDELYYEKQYGKLLEFMNLYETYDERYDVYWEVVNAYIDVTEYIKWTKVSDEQMKNASYMQEFYKNKVLSNAQNPKFSQNRKYLDEFVKML